MRNVEIACGDRIGASSANLLQEEKSNGISHHFPLRALLSLLRPVSVPGQALDASISGPGVRPRTLGVPGAEEQPGTQSGRAAR